MAKVGFWLKGAKGKLAGSTIYKDGNGDTVMSAFSKMKAITDHSFEGVKAGMPS